MSSKDFSNTNFTIRFSKHLKNANNQSITIQVNFSKMKKRSQTHFRSQFACELRMSLVDLATNRIDVYSCLDNAFLTKLLASKQLSFYTSLNVRKEVTFQSSLLKVA